MKSKLFSGIILLLFISTFGQNTDTASKRILLQKQYAKLEKSRTKEHELLKAAGIPPNEYNEQDFKNTLDPATGMPNFASLILLRQDLLDGKFAPKKPLSILGGGSTNVNGKTIINQPWVERGPYNVGGRTRAIMFDPNDSSGKRVFAGGISGGLWVNDDITNSTSEWKPLSQFWANTSVSCITYDPNNPLTFYVGTGECETSDAIGSGIWKTTDGGTTWSNIFTIPVTTDSNGYRSGIFYVNDIKVRNNNGVSEVYAGVSAGYTDAYNGLSNGGLYKSTDGGATFIKNTGFNAYTTTAHSIQQIEIAQDNSVWVSTRTALYTDVPSGGKIFKSTDGVTFTNIYNANLPSARVNFCLSKTNPLKAYALMEGANTNEPVRILKTTDGGATWLATNDATPSITLPKDVDTGIAANDFTRGQAFYDLIIVTDPTDDNQVYVGGIDIFKSTNGAATWTQVSKWSNNNNLAALKVSLVHADQHALLFNPKNNNQMISGCDGGIYFVANKANIATTTGFTLQNTRYNTTQFYSATLNPTKTPASEEFIAGAQDNGTSKFAGAPLANNFYNTSAYTGGDGANTEYDDLAKYIISSYVYNTHYYQVPPSNTLKNIFTSSTDQNLGHFINELAVDRNLDIFYSYRVGLTVNKVTGLLGTLVRSTIKAGTAASGEEVSALRVSPYTTTSSTLFVGSNLGRLFKVTNANTASPTSVLLATPFVGNISDIRFGTSDNQILVTVSNYGPSTVNVFYSDDAGATWQNKEGNLPDMPIRTILMNQTNTSEVLVGTELGVWGTANFMDASPTWAQYSGDMGNVRVTDLDYRPSTFTVLAATYGRGAWTNTIIDNTLASSENNGNVSAKIYPNPSNGVVNLKYDGTKFKSVIVTIFDSSGKLVFTKTNVDSEKSFPTNLLQGYYLVKATSGSDVFFTSSLLIK